MSTTNRVVAMLAMLALIAMGVVPLRVLRRSGAGMVLAQLAVAVTKLVTIVATAGEAKR